MALVIPARNADDTLPRCLESVSPLFEGGHLDEVIVVDDGSTDRTAKVAADFPGVRVLSGDGGGPGSARNIGWRAARAPLVWFVDSDCVVEPHALERLLPIIRDSDVGGVGGSYSNLFPNSLVATLIHEEIVARHRRMPTYVNFLATFNVVYRRAVLDEVGGFDVRFRKAQDAELAYRIREAGHRLGFEPQSRVGHHHPTRMMPYLRTQAAQGYWRVRLYRKHPQRTGGDSYSSALDHVQPPLAVMVLLALPLMLFPGTAWVAPAGALGLLAAQLPMAHRLVPTVGTVRRLAFIPFGFIRAFARGIGMVLAVPSAVLSK